MTRNDRRHVWAMLGVVLGAGLCWGLAWLLPGEPLRTAGSDVAARHERVEELMRELRR